MGTDWIQTTTGKRVHPMDRPIEFDIEDIVSSLSKLCRFNGHTNMFYSVAEHSYHVSCIVPIEDALAGLLHDGTEAYFGDMVGPIKNHPALLPYRTAERQQLAALLLHFTGSDILPDSVRKADMEMLMLEREVLFNPRFDWPIECKPAKDVVISCWTPYEAKDIFMYRYNKITKLIEQSTPRP